MHHRTITPQEFVGLYAELRHPRQIELPGGFSQCGYHPIYGGCVTAHDGDRIGLILTLAALSPLTPVLQGEVVLNGSLQVQATLPVIGNTTINVGDLFQDANGFVKVARQVGGQ